MTPNNIFDSLNMEQVMAFAASPAGNQLMELIQRSSGADMSKAQAHAAAGDLDQAKRELSSLLNNPKIKELLRQFGG